jgi:hypothetical protein
VLKSLVKKLLGKPNRVLGGASVETWDIIASGTCPNCFAKSSFSIKAYGGLAMNIGCRSCNTVYWFSQFRDFGAKRIQGG